MASSQVIPIAATVGVYLLALAAWLGSLVAVAALLVPRNRPAGLDQVWTRFSWLASVSVLVLVVVGSRAAADLRRNGRVPFGRAVAHRGAGARGVVGVEPLCHRVRPAVGLPGEVSERPARRRQQQATDAGAGDRYPDVLCVALLGVAVAQLVVLPVPGRPVRRHSGNPWP